MKNTMKTILGLAALLLVGGLREAQAATAGSCEESPTVYTVSSTARSIALTREYWDGAYDPDSYVRYVRLTLSKGKPYTIRWVYSNEELYGVIDYFGDHESFDPETRRSDGYTETGLYYEQIVITPADWTDCEDASVYLYLFFYGESTGKGSLKFTQEANIPKGLADNPDVISFTTSEQTLNCVLTEEHYGSYHLQTTLRKGLRYVIRTKGGVEGDAHALELDIDYTQEPPEYGILDEGEFDEGYYIIPAEDCVIGFIASGWGQQIPVQFNQMRARTPGEHPATPLAVNARQSFVPGRMNDAGSPYYDRIIDTKLFSFTAKAGERFYAQTDGAVTRLRMMLYDSAGNVLAENVMLSLTDLNCRVAFEAPSAGTYYVGVCEDLEEGAGELSGGSVGITLNRIYGGEGNPDEWDPGDDTFAKASALAPVLTADMQASPVELDAAGHGPHRLSLSDWGDVFSISARAGITYRIKADCANPSDSAGKFLVADVFTLSYDYWGKASETKVTPDDDRISDGEAGVLEFTATANTTYYVRVRVVDIEGSASGGLDYPDYTVHACACAENANEYGVLVVNMMGPAKDSGATWKIASGAATEPNYPFGSTVFVTGSLRLEFSAVANFSTPAARTVDVQAGKTNQVTVVYNDTFDPGDDLPTGAVGIEFKNSSQTLSRTLWTSDDADWFKFGVREGVYYNVSFAERTGDAVIEMYDSQFTLLASGEKAVSLLSPRSTAWNEYFYMKVSHGKSPKEDSSYQLSYNSVDVGVVGFSAELYEVDKNSEFARLVVNRSWSEGSVRVRWGTEAVSAVAGEDYAALSGELTWADGDSEAKTIQIPLIPDLLDENEGGLGFIVRLATVDESELGPGEYIPALTGGGFARVSLRESKRETRPGTVGFSAWGDEQTAFGDASNPVVSVRPGASLRLWVTRKDGDNGRVAVFAQSEDGTAKEALDYDYVGETLAWTSGETTTRCLGVRISPDTATRKSFRITLEATDGTAPTLGAARVEVIIDPSASPVPGAPTSTVRQSRSGEFFGVLCDEAQVRAQGIKEFATVSLSIRDGLATATLTIDGEKYEFSGSVPSVTTDFVKATLTTDRTIAGVNYTDSLELTLCNDTISALAATAGSSSAQAVIHVASEDGLTAEEIPYTGLIFRRSNNEIPAVSHLLERFAGRYTVALPSDEPYVGEPRGVGYLRMDLDGEGGASISGRLADGTPFSTTSRVGFVGSTIDPQGEDAPAQLYVPICASVGKTVVGGVLCLGLNDAGTPVVCLYGASGEGALYWYSDDPNGTLWGDSGFRFMLNPVGGLYDQKINLRAWLANCETRLCKGPYEMLTEALGEGESFAEGYGFDGLSVKAGDSSLTVDSPAVTFSLNRETGIVSGTFALPVVGGEGRVISVEQSGVLITTREDAAWADGEDATVYGFYTLPTTLEGGRTWTDSYPYYVRSTPIDVDPTEDWGFTSTIRFDGNGATAGVPEPITGKVRAVEYIPNVDPAVMVRTGYKFVSWLDSAGNEYVGGDPITMPVLDEVLTAQWTMRVDGIAEALDCAEKGFVFIAGGDEPWYPVDAGAHGGAQCVKSGDIKDRQTCWLQTSFVGEGMLNFWYKTSSEANYDKLIVTLDGKEVLSASGETPWTQFTSEISGKGAHTLRWTYSKDSSGSAGDDSAWIDQLSFGPTVRVVFNPTYGSVVPSEMKYVIGAKFGSLPRPTSDEWTFDGWVDDQGTPYTESSIVPAAPSGTLTLLATWREKEWEVWFNDTGKTSGSPESEYISGLAGETKPLVGAGTMKRNGYDFRGWEYKGQIYAPGYLWTFQRGETVTMEPVWSLSVKGVAEALGYGSDADYTAEGDSAWYPVSDETHNGNKSVRSGVIGDNQKTVLRTTVDGAGWLSFWYKTSSEANYDKFTLTIDGQTMLTASGEKDWTYFDYTMETDGPHVIQWTYSKDSSGAKGKDGAWIAEFRFGPTVTVEFEPNGGELDESQRTQRYIVGDPYTFLPQPESERFGFEGWTNHLGVVVVEEDLADKDTTWLGAQWGKKQWSVAFDVNGAEGQVETKHGYAGESFVLGDPTTIGVSKAGYVFSNWVDEAGGDVYKAGESFVFREANVILKAIWSFDNSKVSSTLDSDLTFALDGDAPWFDQTEKWTTGGSAMRSGAIDNNQSTWIETTVAGPGALSFDWMTSSEQSYDYLAFFLDGSEKARVSGEAAWATYTLDIAEGTHTLRWVYKKDSSTARGDDAGYLDCVMFKPTVRVSFYDDDRTTLIQRVLRPVGDALGELPKPIRPDESVTNWLDAAEQPYTELSVVPDHDLDLYAVWGPKVYTISYAPNGATGGEVPSPEKGPSGAEIQLAAPEADFVRTGYVFGGWADGATIYQPYDKYLIGREDKVLQAVWTLDTTGFDLAMDCEGRAFTADGVAWTIDTTTYAVGLSSLRSGKIADNESTWVQTDVKRGGVLSFWYKTSSEGSYDKLVVTVDGAEILTASGETPWTKFSKELGAGTHAIRWTYKKDISGSKGDDCAWIDGFAFEPKKWTLSFEANGGTGKVPEPIQAEAGARIELPSGEGLTRDYYNFAGWRAGDKVYQAGDNYGVLEANVAFKAEWALNTDILAAALDSDKKFTAGGSAEPPWLVVRDVTYGTESALRSGAVPDNGYVVLTNKFSGAGTLSFAYKVSSEQNYDKLFMAIDGRELEPVSGEVDWTVYSEDLEDGEHTVVWKYQKDSSTARGDDCVWLDRVTWKPKGYSVLVTFDEGIESVKIGGKAVESGESVFLEGESGDFDVTAYDWFLPNAQTKEPIEPISHSGDQIVSYRLTPAGDCSVAFTSAIYPEGSVITLGGKSVDANRAAIWGVLYDKSMAEFPNYYSDYLLNEAPGSNGGIVVSGISVKEGVCQLTVERTNDKFLFTRMNGKAVVLSSETLKGEYTSLESDAVTVKSEERTLTLTFEVPAGETRFYKAAIR